MKNKVFSNPTDKICEVILIGDQTSETIDEVLTETMRLDIEQMRLHGQVVTLFDLREIGKFDDSVVQSALRGMKAINFDKVAIVGATHIGKNLLQPIIILTGKEDKVLFFDERAEAVKWLTVVDVI
jgi:hypothetical protein